MRTPLSAAAAAGRSGAASSSHPPRAVVMPPSTPTSGLGGGLGAGAGTYSAAGGSGVGGGLQSLSASGYESSGYSSAASAYDSGLSDRYESDASSRSPLPACSPLSCIASSCRTPCVVERGLAAELPEPRQLRAHSAACLPPSLPGCTCRCMLRFWADAAGAHGEPSQVLAMLPCRGPLASAPQARGRDSVQSVSMCEAGQHGVVWSEAARRGPQEVAPLRARAAGVAPAGQGAGLPACRHVARAAAQAVASAPAACALGARPRRHPLCCRFLCVCVRPKVTGCDGAGQSRAGSVSSEQGDYSTDDADDASAAPVPRPSLP